MVQVAMCYSEKSDTEQIESRYNSEYAKAIIEKLKQRYNMIRT